MADSFEDYQKDYPNLINDIITFFDSKNALRNNKLQPRKVIEFCLDKNGKAIYQPPIIDRICKILCNHNLMSCINNTDGMGINNAYIVFDRSQNIDTINKKIYYNSIVYGSSYIYHYYKNYVKLILTKDEKGDFHCGTSFLFWNGIVTAKHCITDVKQISIEGFTAAELNKSTIYISDNPYLDLAYIDLGKETSPNLLVGNGEVLQNVLVMGYPKIPSFSSFLTVEEATISSISELRLTPTVGNIAAIEEQYLNKIKAMLITAKIKGGNSGGPVINNLGQLVAIACQVPDYTKSQGDLDDLGYGIAIPSKYLIELIEKRPDILKVKDDFFVDNL